MATTTYKSTARTFDYKTPTNKASPIIGYKITATRSSSTSSKVTLKLSFSVGWNNSKVGSKLTDPFKMSVQVGSNTLSVSVNIPECTGTAGTLYDRNSTTAYSVATGTTSKEITWTSGNALNITGTCTQAFIGETESFSGGSISMPEYSGGSGGDSGGSTTTIGANRVSISLSPTSITRGGSSTLIISSTIGSNNGISGYQIYENNSLLTTITSKTYTVTPTSTSTYYVIAVSTKGSSYNKTSSSKTLTVNEITPTISDAYISPTSVSTITGGTVRLYATTNVTTSSGNNNSFSYYINGSLQGYDWYYTDIFVNAGDVITVKAYNGNSGVESTSSKRITVGGYTPVSVNSINISPQIIKDNISSPDLAKIISGSISYSGPVTSITWYYRQAGTSSGLNSASWVSLGISSSSFSNINMEEKVSSGGYYQFKAIIMGSDNADESEASEIYQIPAMPSGAIIKKVIPKADPSQGYETIVQDGKIFYGSGLFVIWTNPTVTDSQMPIKEIELVYSSKSSSDPGFTETKVAQITYHSYLENGITYSFNNSFPYNAILPTGATGNGGGADLEVLSLHETMIGIRVTDELDQSTETFFGTTYYKAESPSFGGNLIVSQSSFRPFTCNTNETFTLSSSVGQSNSQDSLYYFIDCYVGDRKVTIPIINKIPIATSIFSDTSKESGYVIYSNDNFTITKYNGTTIYYTIKNSYLKSLLLSSEGLRSPKNNLSAIYNDDFFDVVYKISVRDDFDSRSTVYNSNTISINFIEAPTLSNNNYLDIGVNRYLKSLNPFSDNSIIMATTTSNNNNRIINPGESVIFKFKRAQDYNAADYISTMLGDVTQYNIYVSRNDEPVTSNYENLTYTLLKTYLVEELKKALPADSTDEYYYLEYPLQSYQESKFVTFRMEAVDSKGMKSEYLYSNTYLVPCRATSMDFYLRTVDLKSDNGGVFLIFTTKVNDFGAATFINDLYGYETNNSYYSYPNYERQFTVNNETFSRKGRLIFEATLDGNFNNKNTAVLAETQYNNYFSFTNELTDYLLPDSTYLDVIGKENNLNNQHNSIRIDLPEEWQKTNATTGEKELADDLDKIFFRITYEIAYGFKDLEASDYDKYLTVVSISAPYSYYEDAPTVSYRNHQVGINTKDFQRNSEIGQNEVLIIQDNGNYNLVVFKGAEQKITLDLRERTFTAVKDDSEEVVTINFGLGVIKGMTIDGGEWT